MPNIKFNIDNTIMNLRGLKSRIVAEAEIAMYDATEYLTAESVRRSPFKTGQLEQGHAYSISHRGDEIVGEIKVSGAEVPYWKYPYRDVKPEGPKNLGELSQQKQDATDKIVGGGFLWRAVYEEDDAAYEIIHDALRRYLNKGR